MTIRQQLPVYSPLSLGALTGGLWSAITGGPSARQRVSELCRLRYPESEVVLTESGTSALTLALRAASRRRPGRPVALPAYGCFDLATAAVGAGSQVLLYDLDPGTLGPDLDTLRAVTRLEPAAIVVAHWYGILADLKPVSALAKESGALLVEDAAQSLGAGREGEPSGGRGAFGVLSFGRGKGVTGGRGGALLLNDPEAKRTFADQDAGLHQGGIGLVEFPPLLAQFVFARPALYRLPASLPFLGLGETPFHLPRPPSGMSALSAGVLGRTWELAAAELELRRRNAARLLRSLPSHGLVGIAGAPQDGPGYLRLPVLDRGDGTRFASRPARDLGIMPGYPLSLGDLPGFTNRVLNPDSPLSGARLLAQRLGTLPTHSRLREIDLVRLEAWLTAPA